MSIDLQVLRKIALSKKYQGQFFENLVGGPHSQGGPNFDEGVGDVDGGPRGLFNGEKNSALRLSHLEFN